LSRKARIFFPEFNIRLYDKNSESDYFFFSSSKIRIFFFSNIGNQNIFLEKKHNPPPLQVKWSFPKKIEVIEQTQKVYFWANQGDELQPKKVVKSEIELGLPFMALDLVYKS
jgi:hypothetical protein